MGNSFEEEMVAEKIKISALKHCGNMIEISKETGYAFSYVQKILKKVRMKERMDADPHRVLVADNLYQYLLKSHQQRRTYLNEMMRDLEYAKSRQVSVCCNARIIPDTDAAGVVTNKCRLCGVACAPTTMDRLDVIEMELKVLEAIEKQDITLAAFAVKMGYTNAQPAGPSIKQDVFVFGASPNNPAFQGQPIPQVHFDGKDRYTLEQIEQMPPAEREKLRRELKREIIELSREDAVDVKHSTQK